MSATWLNITDPSPAQEQKKVLPPESEFLPEQWNPERFAKEQIRGLVARVFYSSRQPVRQIVFGALEAATDVRNLCLQVAETLAVEMLRDVAVLGNFPRALSGTDMENVALAERENRGTRLRQTGTRLHKNLWLLPFTSEGEDRIRVADLQTYMGEVRAAFEYSIVAAPSTEETNEATAMAQFADGIVLVISAQRTRRIAALKMKERLEQLQVQLLGTVLSNRQFPIPAGIYRRL